MQIIYKPARRIYGKTAGKIQTQSKVPPIDFHAKTGLAVEYTISGNMAQASTQEYSITDIPPIDFMSDGNGLSAYSIYGNMQQIGQPAPDAPITPEECGDKTENLFDDNNAEYGKWVNSNGTIATNATYAAGYDIKVGTASEFAVKYYGDKPYSYSMAFYDSNGDFLSRTHRSNPSTSYDTFSVPENAVSARFQVAIDTSLVITETRLKAIKLMLNTGSTALPYEPFGYKIPVTNAGTTTNIYTLEPIRKIGDYADIVDSTNAVTRLVFKYEFTGLETFGIYSGVPNTFRASRANIGCPAWVTGGYSVLCTHFATVDGTTDLTNGTCYQGSYLYFRLDSCNIETDFKSYLAQQYSNGTPVTVWYVLATAETESITSPTISTNNGNNTLSIGTTLQPSNVSLTTSSSVYPKNPIIPVECGDKTDNLWDENYTPVSSALKYVPIYVGNGDFTLSTTCPKALDDRYPCLFFFAGIASSGAATGTNDVRLGLSRTVTAVDGYVTVAFRSYDDVKPADYQTMLNAGSTAATYEPYGYKIPLNLNSTISNIYLSQPIRKIGNYSDSIDYENGTVTRKIKKLVLTGQESGWAAASTGRFRYYRLSMGATGTLIVSHAMSTHFQRTLIDSTTTVEGVDTIASPSTGYDYISIRPENVSIDYTTLSDFKDYLAQQYSTGTPIIVWYVLATPEVEQITPPTITPSIESNTISVNTTLQPSNLSITYTSPDYSEIKLVYDNQGNILYNDPPYHDWGAVRWIVRQGLGSQYYPIGYIFYDNFNESTGTAYQVVAHNHHFDPNLTALGYTYSMTCLEVKLNDYMVFDNIEAFLYTDTIIPAGTYKFTIPNYDATYGGNKTYYFTSTADLPAGSQIVMNWPYQQTPKTVTAYSPSGTTMVQTITTATTGWNGLTLTEYVDGTSPTATDLGTIAGPTTQLGSSNYGQMNHIHRARYGSNNYLQSGIRQYLNSNSAANTWWQPQTIFDRPYGGRTFAGKLTKLNQNLVDVLATPTIQSRTNQYFETTSLDGTTFTLSTNYDITTDKLFLLSPMEVNFNTTDTTVGTVLDYYVNATNTDRIKIRTSTGTAGVWWLRTPYPTSALSERSVYTSGALYNINANHSYGCAPAWVIQ